MPFAAFIQAFVQALTAAAQRPIPGSGDALFAACRAFSLQAGAVAVTALWQGAVVACGLAICLRLVPRTSAEHRFAVWAAAFVTLVALPILALSTGSAAGVVTGFSSAANEAAARPWLSIDARWSLLIAALWAAAALFRAVDLGLHSFRLRKLWKDAIPVPVDSNLNSMPASIWTRGPVQVCTTATLQRPSVIGFFKPAHPYSRLALRPPHPRRARADRAPRSRTSAPPRRLDQSFPKTLPGSLPAESRARVDRAPSLPRARDGLRRRRYQNYACAARLCRLSHQPRRAPISSVALRLCRWEPGSAAPSWSTASTAFCAETAH